MSSLYSGIRENQLSTNRTIILAAIWIITEVFSSKSRTPTLIAQYADNKAALIEQSDIVEAILLGVFSTPRTRVMLEADKSYDNNKKSFFDFYRNLNDEEQFYRLDGIKDRAIWFLDSMDSFRRLTEDLLKERNHYYRNGFFCIVYTGQETDLSRSLSRIFRRLFKIFVININVLINVGRTVYVYTYYPFSKSRCHNNEPHFHGIFGPSTNYKYSRRNFFPKKLLNMWRCKIRVTTWTELPFIDIEYNRTTGELLRLDGIEGRLLLLLAERMNFSIEIVEEPQKRIGNGTEPGSIKMLSDGRTNISIGCLKYDIARQQVAQAAYTYMHVPMNLVIPLGVVLSPLERLMRPFKYIIWSCLSSSVLGGILVIFLLKALSKKTIQEFVFGYGNRIPFTNLWNVFYGGPISGSLPRRNFARYLLGMWLFYTLVLRSAYLAQLFLILQDSRARSDLVTVDETLKQNFTFYAYPSTAPILRDAAASEIRISFLDAEDILLLKLFKFLGEVEDSNIVVTILGPIVVTYNQDPENFNYRVNILQEPLINVPLTFYMRKHSYLAYEINELLLSAISAGLVSRFENLFLTKWGSMTPKPGSEVSMPLSLLAGLFYVHIFLLILSTFVFFLERWSKHSPIAQNVINFFNS